METDLPGPVTYQTREVAPEVYVHDCRCLCCGEAFTVTSNMRRPTIVCEQCPSKSRQEAYFRR